MKSLVAGVLIGLCFGFIQAHPALAHTADQDGRISGLLHIDPDDIARAGRINTIHIYFNDQDSRFTMEGCDCRFKLTQGNKALYNQFLTAADIKTAQAQVFLPKNNFSYTVVISGTPKTAGFFQPFKLNFDIDVGNPPRTPVDTTSSSKYLLPAAVLIVISATTSGYLLLRKRIRIKK